MPFDRYAATLSFRLILPRDIFRRDAASHLLIYTLTPLPFARRQYADYAAAIIFAITFGFRCRHFDAGCRLRFHTPATPLR